MKAKSQEIIEEIEACKDILWFLKGYTANTDYSITRISHQTLLQTLLRSTFHNGLDMQQMQI